MKDNSYKKESPIHVVKCSNTPLWQTIVIKLSAVFIGLIIGSIFCALISQKGNNPFEFFAYLFKGVFGSSTSRGSFVQKFALLVLVSFALLPAFKMKFWNLGGNGQILIGALVTTMFMKFMGGKAPDAVVIILMVVFGVLAGAVWAVIPAIFKAFFKTNESLFTLMMNYIAVGLTSYFLAAYGDSGSGTLKPISAANLNIPGVKNSANLICAIVAVVVFAFIFIYFKFSKHGFEVSVVGESENTARYVGMNVKKVIIRTMVLSGAICGLVGVLLAGSINHTVSTSTANNMGFTAIMVAWLGKLDPIMMLAAAFFISFVDKGMSSVRTNFGLTNNAASNIVLGVIYFCIIASEFFLEYSIKRRKKAKEPYGNYLDKGGNK